MPTKSSRKKKSGKGSAPADGTHVPEHIEPSNIRKNPRNPRLDFPQKRIEALADSIEEQGVLVPLTVYRDPDGETEYVLLDGERRWRAATLINAPSVPAWVIPKPTGVENVLRMFNIHMMRDEWGEMATALALKEIMAETAKTSETELRKLTGLGVDRIRNMKRVLAFPEEWHERVLSGEVPFNLLVELDKNVLTKAREPEKQKVIGASETELRDLFLTMYDDAVLGDVVDLRKVGTLIDTATGAQTPPKVKERAAKAIRGLVKKRNLSINDAYQYGAAASVEIRGILRDVDDLPGRIEDVIASELQDDERERLHAALNRLNQQIGTILARLDNA
jgi:ParB/RepB/Spo0J family partition protein